MALILPSTISNPTAGQPITAAWGDAVNDAVAFLANPPKCRVYNSAAISTAHATSVPLTFNSERFDTDSMHSTVSNTGRITFTTAGTYYVGGDINWASAAGNLREAVIRLNGTTQIAGQRMAPIGAGFGHTANLSALYAFSAGDYVELLAYQDSGGAINVTACEFYAVWVSL